jgi:hypothetical protein
LGVREGCFSFLGEIVFSVVPTEDASEDASGFGAYEYRDRGACSSIAANAHCARFVRDATATLVSANASCVESMAMASRAAG